MFNAEGLVVGQSLGVSNADVIGPGDPAFRSWGKLSLKVLAVTWLSLILIWIALELAVQIIPDCDYVLKSGPPACGALSPFVNVVGAVVYLAFPALFFLSIPWLIVGAMVTYVEYQR